MKIIPIITPKLVQAINKKEGDSNNAAEASFGDFLKNAVNEVNNLQIQSAEKKRQLITGEIENVHDVMITAEKADLAFELTLQVRNKIVEAYQEIMRTQI